MPISDKRAVRSFRDGLGGSCLPAANVRRREETCRYRQSAKHKQQLHLPSSANAIHWKYSLLNIKGKLEEKEKKKSLESTKVV